MADGTIWGIHAGATGDAETLFLKGNVVAIGWDQFGDLSQCQTREQYRVKYAKVFPNDKAGAIPVNAGQLFRFVREMKVGDLVAYPSKLTREIHLGRVTGDYAYRPEARSSYPNQRTVTWLKAVPRTAFTQGALYEIGSAMSFFQIKTYAEEYLALLAGKPAEPVVADDTVAGVTAEIEEQTRDFVLKRLSQNLKGLPLEAFVVHLLQRMGYKARLTPTNEPSVDIIAHKDALGLEPPIIKVQVKSGDGKITDKDVSALFGKLSPGEFGLVVALGSFTPPAIQFANNKSNLRLVDGSELVDLVFQHYEQFDSQFKSLLPLKKVYVPEVLGE
jgi:restriction system protein